MVWHGCSTQSQHNLSTSQGACNNLLLEHQYILTGEKQDVKVRASHKTMGKKSSGHLNEALLALGPEFQKGQV